MGHFYSNDSKRRGKVVFELFYLNSFVFIRTFVPKKVNLNSVLRYHTSRDGKQSARSEDDL